jgi:predicted transcriptional regulator
MALVQTLAGAGPTTLREAARRLGRNVQAVHSDVHLLLAAGVLRKDEDGRIEFPYTAVHVDFILITAAQVYQSAGLYLALCCSRAPGQSWSGTGTRPL